MRFQLSLNAPVLTGAALLGGPALAQTLAQTLVQTSTQTPTQTSASPPRTLTPPAGWVAAGSGTWRDSSGACVLRVQQFSKPFAVLASQTQALTLGGKLQRALSQSGMNSVTFQPVGPPDSGLTPPGEWGVLAAYTYAQAGVSYQIAQLYFSQGGQLRTVTGSNSAGEASACVNTMRNFLKGKL